MHSLEISKLQFENERHTLLCILELFTNVVHELSLKNAWLLPIFLLDFNNTCYIYLSCINGQGLFFFFAQYSYMDHLWFLHLMQKRMEIGSLQSI